MLILTFQICSLTAALSTALLAGTYFIFHNTVMQVLAEQGSMKTMNRINEVILNRTFLALFMLSPVSSLLLLVTGLAEGILDIQTPVLYGALLSILGFVITIRFNVPLNDRLARSVEIDKNRWKRYLVHWVAWNQRRYYISTLALAGLIV
ncbi:anthrone oxygenase family protein [Vibrio sp. HN007]|uniref:anthrone oxygenase family protein n=1 Tax=Vibrio iocasae TaxID=3098914 RepID=UPI0035D4525D